MAPVFYRSLNYLQIMIKSYSYFDGQEREFRGFGMVEQWDTEDWLI